MNNKMFLLAGILALCGCSTINSTWNRLWGESDCFGPDCPNSTVIVEESYASAPATVCQDGGDPSLCATDPFVNYTRTPADFRRYGERTPRDQRISQAAAGNNISASIPPSIEDEVVAYEAGAQIISEPEEKASEPTAEPTAQETPEQTSEPAPAPAELATEGENCPEGLMYEETCVAIEDEDEEKEPSDDEVKDWVADEGQNLKALLTEWSDISGWRLIWNTNRNYVLSAGAIFRGNFADVSSALIRAFARARPAPIATFYKGNRVLVVETMEDENAYE